MVWIWKNRNGHGLMSIKSSDGRSKQYSLISPRGAPALSSDDVKNRRYVNQDKSLYVLSGHFVVLFDFGALCVTAHAYTLVVPYLFAFHKGKFMLIKANVLKFGISGNQYTSLCTIQACIGR